MPTTTPVIISQPSDVINSLVGATVNLTVTATSGQPLGYQWYYTDSGKSSPMEAAATAETISGSTNATLTLTSVATAQTGGYQVVITNANGSITSRVAQVSIVTAPFRRRLTPIFAPIGSHQFCWRRGVLQRDGAWRSDRGIPMENDSRHKQSGNERHFGATGATLPLANLTQTSRENIL